jgi:integrase
MTEALSTKFDQWPALDQELWLSARQQPEFLSASSPAKDWSDRRCRIVTQSYGQWLAFLKRTGRLDADRSPGAHATPECVAAFIEELQSRVSPCSVGMMTGALLSMLCVLSPDMDWSWLRRAYSRLKAIAKPTRDKRAHMVPPEQLFDLGLRLMTEADDERLRGYEHAATKGRDGLMIALLICCPVRIANLTEAEIGHHLLYDVDRYILRFSEAETKTGREFEGELPPEMTPWVEKYLAVHRTDLFSRSGDTATSRLWIDRWGKPMEEASIRAQIKKRTRDAFGPHVWPHLFRNIAVTGFVDYAPEDIVLAPDLLGHSTLQTTQRHYILARGTGAHQKVQAMVLRGRKEAIERQKAQRLNMRTAPRS